MKVVWVMKMEVRVVVMEVIVLMEEIYCSGILVDQCHNPH
jgi:hypothetical protein